MDAGEFKELTVFMAIVNARGFRGAAISLGMTPSSVSRTLSRMEQRLGMRLLNRTTRSVSPTEAGELLYSRLAPVLLNLDGVMEQTILIQESPTGTVRLNLPRLAAEHVFAPRLAQFTAAYPGVRLNLVIDDDLTDVIAAGFDAGIRIGALVAQDMVTINLTGPYRVAVVGSPAYFAGRPRPDTPRDLHDHACLVYRWATSGKLHRWRFDGQNGPLYVDVDGPLVVNDTGIIRQAAIAGVGLAYLPETSIAEHLSAGRLVRVLEDWCEPFPGFFLYHPSRKQTPPGLRALITFLTGPQSLTPVSVG
ncbi:LysR family transcriptional regulator [Phyllobacterium sp. 22229]|jgi:DNA-binding transcriptional LysR family regulator|uniref:LysR family transcriptional regulator n=1 Tax=Phyllobacterium myrsinacearum TaxID=28101 RepID=A0A2S9JAL9_9HYPH|nr:LysR family transcriptional regulator [Phyllobacterium myrsinacearum]PRD49825.1 LysR family transcriptional regulator [Phyllobacterium myrsinacearum]PWV83962.1 LysR family transcriptional regulator [Phyllobacterium myrsinacearum]RZU96973.1 LysR family transcriptional regulator [Phyllobacterium myrsinacearum]